MEPRISMLKETFIKGSLSVSSLYVANHNLYLDNLWVYVNYQDTAINKNNLILSGKYHSDDDLVTFNNLINYIQSLRRGE